MVISGIKITFYTKYMKANRSGLQKKIFSGGDKYNPYKIFYLKKKKKKKKTTQNYCTATRRRRRRENWTK